ncbi:Fc.00g042160.m01.CDS01 [Cosmosporella sp. VM-42]
MQLTWDLGMDHVRHWVLKGDFEQETLPEEPDCWSSTVVTGLSEAAIPQPGTAASPSPFTTPSAEQHLQGTEDDPLIPSQSQINQVFNNGVETWRQFHHDAVALPRGVFPPGLNPSIMMKDMPPLPDTVPQKGVLVGSPTWIVPDPEQREPQPTQPSQRIGRDLDLDLVTGVTKYFRLGYETPLACRLSSDPGMGYYGKTSSAPSSPTATATATAAATATAPDGLAILTMCWSYIFSTRLLQLQGRKAHYSNTYIRPIPAQCVGPVQDNEILLHLGDSASPRLVHWICALLAPTPGWASDDLGGEHSPWSACCSGDLQFVISTDKQVHIDRKAKPPTPDEALELLIEFCNLFGIRHEQPQSEAPTALSPIKAAFLATLAIPFYRMAKLEPQLPRPTLTPKKVDAMDDEQTDSIRRYLLDAAYYMTLSMHPYALGPVLWSIFWQPDIECNLVSPWLSAITKVIGPAIETQDFELLAKIFCVRRPRVSLWWHGLFLLGSPQLLVYIRNYLETLDEGCSYDTLARPDIVSSVWTGALHSYQDEDSPNVYHNIKGPVSRADLLQHRHTLTLRDPWPLFYGWRPFGNVPKHTIEPDLYPWLEHGHKREYRHWTWWSKTDPDFEPISYAGYRLETRNFNTSVPDRLSLIPSKTPLAPIPADITLNLLPSKKATLQMIAHSLGNIIGERSASTAVIPGLTQQHPWLKDWTAA